MTDREIDRYDADPLAAPYGIAWALIVSLPIDIVFVGLICWALWR